MLTRSACFHRQIIYLLLINNSQINSRQRCAILILQTVNIECRFVIYIQKEIYLDTELGKINSFINIYIKRSSFSGTEI